MAANDRQVGGDHYTVATGVCPHCRGIIQHWDLYGDMPYLVGQVTKYATRSKNGFEDLEKAMHFLQKLIESRYPNVQVRVLIDDESKREVSAKRGK